MPTLETNSVDMVLTDMPYGTTSCKWDSIIQLNELWPQIQRVTKEKSAIVMTASQPFTSILVQSNIEAFKHEWVWEKNRGSNFATVKYQPMKEHESILVFGYGVIKYYPIKEPRKGAGAARVKYKFNGSNTGKREAYNSFKDGRKGHNESELRYPSSIQKHNVEVGLHPTQKPVSLMEYLINTYTDVGDMVLDIAMGSGTTGIACQNTERQFIGIEKEKEYFDIAKSRLDQPR